MTPQRQSVFQYALFFVAAILSLATIASFIAASFGIFEMASHFPVQYGVGLVVLSCIFLWQKRFIVAWVVLVCACANGFILYPSFTEVHAQPHSSQLLHEETFLALLANVDHYNRDFGRLNELIQESQPDLIVLLEVDKRWMEGLTALGAEYSNRVVWPDPTTGIAILSREPIFHSQVSNTEGGNPWITAGIRMKGKELILIGAHPPAPVSRGNWELRNKQLETLSHHAATFQQAVLILGDLNITPWSPYFKKFLLQGRLTDWRSKFGWLPTWPAGIPLFWIPIDHVVTNIGVDIHEYVTGPDIGSDHYPILVKGSLRSVRAATRL